MLDLRRTNSHLHRRGLRGRGTPSTDPRSRELAYEGLDQVAKVYMPDIAISIMAHAKDSGALRSQDGKITQYRLKDYRPAFAKLLGGSIWQSEIDSLGYLAEKRTIVTGPRLTQFDIAAFIRLYSFLNHLFITKISRQDAEYKTSVAELIRALAGGSPREYYRALVSLSGFLSTTVRVEAASKKYESFLGEETPLLCHDGQAVLAKLNELLSLPEYQGRDGSTKLMEAGKQVRLDFSASALEAMFIVGTPFLVEQYPTGTVDICNMTEVVHPDSDKGRELGIARIRCLAAIGAFRPYVVQDGKQDKSRSHPMRVLNLEAIAAISGRHRMYREQFGKFLRTVIWPLAKYVGELWCEAKSNLHILFPAHLTKMSNYAYQKIQEKFQAAKRAAKAIVIKNEPDTCSKPKVAAESKFDSSTPKNKNELMTWVNSIRGRKGPDTYQFALETLGELAESAVDFPVALRSYQLFKEKYLPLSMTT